jgi:hypothetical protein
MRTIDKDFKHLRVPDQELSFANGFMTALILVIGLVKLLEGLL